MKNNLENRFYNKLNCLLTSINTNTINLFGFMELRRVLLYEYRDNVKTHLDKRNKTEMKRRN